MDNLISKLDEAMKNEYLIPHHNTANYAVPPEFTCAEYDEVYREYIFRGKVFTIMVRQFKDKGNYWVRCGYKFSIDAKNVEGIGGRDITTDDENLIICHCTLIFYKTLNHNTW